MNKKFVYQFGNNKKVNRSTVLTFVYGLWNTMSALMTAAARTQIWTGYLELHIYISLLSFGKLTGKFVISLSTYDVGTNLTESSTNPLEGWD
jgi:hypothetical protein